MEPTILVVDDEPEILRAVRSGLAAQGYTVVTAADGSQALRQAELSQPAVIILDLVMPGDYDGIEVTRRLREWTRAPIIVLSALNKEEQKVRALDMGADDYLTKPFGMNELSARVRVALRRSAGQGHADPAVPFAARDLTVDYHRRLAAKSGQELRLTPYEYDILRYLTQNADRVITHRQLLSAVWGPENADETQYLRVHIGHLRRKIEDDPARPAYIVTEPGVGYRFRTLLAE